METAAQARAFSWRTAGTGAFRQGVAFTLLAALGLFTGLTTREARGQVADEEQRARLAAISQAYLAHRESFRQLHVKYRIIIGKAASAENALRAELLPDAVEAAAEWAADGTAGCCKRFLDSSQEEALWKIAASGMPKGATVRIGSMPISAEQLLHDAARGTIHFAPAMGRGAMGLCTVTGAEIPVHGVYLTPFDMGIMGGGERANPGRALEQCLQAGSGWTATYRGTEDVRGSTCEVIATEDPFKTTTVWYLDREIGYLPRRATQSRADGANLGEAHILETVACAGARHFPARSVWYAAAADGSHVRVRSLIVDEHQIDQPPPAGALAIDLPANTLVNDGTRGQIQFRLPTSFTVTLENAGELLALGKAGPGAAPMADEGARFWRQALLWGNLGLALLALVACLAWRRRRRKLG